MIGGTQMTTFDDSQRENKTYGSLSTVQGLFLMSSPVPQQKLIHRDFMKRFVPSEENAREKHR